MGPSQLWFARLVRLTDMVLVTGQASHQSWPDILGVEDQESS